MALSVNATLLYFSQNRGTRDLKFKNDTVAGDVTFDLPPFVELISHTGTLVSSNVTTDLSTNQWVITPDSNGFITLTLRPRTDLSLGVEEGFLDATYSTFATHTALVWQLEPERVELDEIIDDILLGINKDSYLYGRQKYQLKRIAEGGLTQMALNSGETYIGYEAIIDANGFVQAPVDMVKYLDVFWVDDNGYLHPLYSDGSMNTAYSYSQDQNGNLILDQFGNILSAAGLTPRVTNLAAQNIIYDFYDWETVTDRMYKIIGYPGGKTTAAGSFVYDKYMRRFQFLNTTTTNVVIVYLADPIQQYKIGTTNRKPSISRFFVEAMKAYIYWSAIKYQRNVPEGAKVQAKQDFYNEYRNARKALKINPGMLRQLLHTS